MFFMMGVMPGRKDFEFHQVITCDACGAYGRYNVYMTYTVLSIFFIPIFKWSKRYFVETSCCHRTYELDPEIGARIARGEEVSIMPQDLTSEGGGYNTYRRCPDCGFMTDENYEFCPMCGARLE